MFETLKIIRYILKIELEYILDVMKCMHPGEQQVLHFYFNHVFNQYRKDKPNLQLGYRSCEYRQNC